MLHFRGLSWMEALYSLWRPSLCIKLFMWKIRYMQESKTGSPWAPGRPESRNLVYFKILAEFATGGWSKSPETINKHIYIVQ